MDRNITNLTDLGWDEERKSLATYLAHDLLEAVEDMTPQELVKHWCLTSDFTDEAVVREIRELYATLPRVKLEAWKRVNTPVKDVHRGARRWMNQVKFVDAIASRIFGKEQVFVVATRPVEEVVLPVYRLDVEKYGLQLTFAGDFSEWEVAVSVEQGLGDFKLTGEFKKEEMAFVNFPEEVRYKESFIENQHRFSIKLSSDYELYAFMYNLKNHLER